LNRSSSAGVSRFLLGVSLVLVAFNLRPALSSIGPVLPEALAGTGLVGAQSALLTTVPVFCLGLFGLAAPRLARSQGLERTILAFLVLLALGLGVRAFERADTLVLGCALGGVAIGVVNVLLPGVVKRDFSDRAPFMTGLYTMALCGGAAVAAGATAPLEAVFGSWSFALAVWALPAAVAVLVWAWVAQRAAPPAAGPVVEVGGLWRDPLAWQVTLFTGLQSSLAYSVFAWLAPILRDRGLSPIDAGLAVSASVLVQVPSTLVAPVLAARGKDQRVAVLATVGLSVVGLLGCMVAPMASIWAWVVLLGIGQGAVFAVALTIIVLRAPDAALAAKLSSMAQGVGYMVASAGPLLIGLLHAWTGDWTAPGVLLVALGAGAAFTGWSAGRSASVRPGSVLPKAPGGA